MLNGGARVSCGGDVGGVGVGVVSCALQTQAVAPPVSALAAGVAA